jgi:glycosyltransferase involved in cell wall biosynthesis
MFEIQRVLRAAGFESRIFGEHIASGLDDRILPITAYDGDPASLLIVHHSMGFDAFDKIVSLPDVKILRYHNITPAHYLPNPHLQAYAKKGIQQLNDYVAYVDIAIGASNYSREELARVGFRYTAVLPIFFRTDVLLKARPDRSVLRQFRQTFNILFVGRICPNKKQDDLVRIFAHYHRHYDPNARLILVGSSEGSEEYAQQVRLAISAERLEGVVSLTGKVSLSQLAAYYRSAHAFLCLSEHEGFCVPLLEAMSFCLPVVAYDAAAVPETLGNAGVVLGEKDPELWCEVTHELREDNNFRTAIISGEQARLGEFNLDRTSARLLEVVRSVALAPKAFSERQVTVQIQGPFETSYSLASVNRNLAVALDERGSFDVSIFCTEGPGDYTPEEKSLIDKPRARWLWQKGNMLSQRPDVVIRNLYPPRVNDARGKTNFLYFFWEDSLVPSEWIVDFNRSLTGILAPSRHVERVLRDSGVTIPIHFLHPGVEETYFDAARPGRRDEKKSFLFLHVSSGFPRKGVDRLLAAYFNEFSKQDDVSLIIKTFPNIHNDVDQQISNWRQRCPAAPECIHIHADIDQREIKEFYRKADCLVYPSRGEGFGLPIAEAMASGIPVVVTGYGGHMDFCNEQNAFLIDYRLVPSRSHLNVPGAQWAEPDSLELRQQMRLVYNNRDTALVRSKVETAYRTVEANFRWPITAARCAEIVSGNVPEETSVARQVAMVTTWDSRCGIAEYSRYLLEAVARECPELRVQVLSSPGEGVWDGLAFSNRVCWKPRPKGSLEQLRRIARGSQLDVFHFQFNFGFFDLQDLSRTILDLKRLRKKVLITFHRTADLHENGKLISLAQIAAPLAQADLLLVHNKIDEQRLKSFGIDSTIAVLPHGSVVFPHEERELRNQWRLPFNPVISTFGFLLPHKGILELLAAVQLLRADFPNLGLLAQCALHQDKSSQQFEHLVRQRIKELGCSSNVMLSTRLIPPEEAALFLQLSDLVVLPYKDTSESASGAVRFALASGRPVITTKSAIFADVADATWQIESSTPQSIAEGIRTVLGNPTIAERFAERARSFAEATSWDRIGKVYAELIASL